MYWPTCPPAGISGPVRYSHCRDGDTPVVIGVLSGMEWAVRLIDCWCPELSRGDAASKAIGKQAKAVAHKLLSGARELTVFVPFHGEHAIAMRKNGQALNVAQLFTFDRVPGYLYVDGVPLNKLLVEAGLASTTKGGALGS